MLRNIDGLHETVDVVFVIHDFFICFIGLVTAFTQLPNAEMVEW